MRPRISISVKIILLALLNMVLLAAMALFFAGKQFRFDFSSFLLGPAHERIVSVSRLLALDLRDTDPSHWNSLLAHYSSQNPAQFYLVDDEGAVLAGRPVSLPQELIRHLHRPPPEDRGGPPPMFGPPPGPPIHPGERGPLHLVRTANPVQYWVSVPIPIWDKNRDEPISASLVWRFSKLWTEPYFFDYRPWIHIIVAVILASLLCWLPLIRGLTRTISRMTAATRRIADGHFDVRLRTSRRDELGELGDSINRMSERLAGYVNGQRRFLSDIAHELSSPVARMQAAVAVLDQRNQANEYVQDLAEEVDHIAELVNELLSFSKAQSSEKIVKLIPVPLDRLFRRVVDREGRDGALIRIQPGNATTALADPDLLFRALANVLRNAVRYAREGGPIEIAAAQHDGRVRITVADNGPGLPEAELENVFRPFYRPEFARRRETGGTGLGLAIVRNCVEACEGRVSCSNRVPHGLEVAIELLAEEPDREAQPSKP